MGKWLKAGGIFVLSLSLTASIALALSLRSPPPECGFPIDLRMERDDGELRAVVESVEGDIRVAMVEYKVVRLQGDASTTLVQGNLTEALAGEVVFHPMEPTEPLLRVGDYVTVEDAGEDTHLLLVSHDGAPLAWTAGCDG